VENVRILGRGMIDRPKGQLTVQASRNVSVEGLTFLTPLHGTIACSSSQQVRFSDIRTFSNGQWSDGINVFACKDVDIDGAFVRTSDDSVAIYATRKDARGDTQNIRVRNSIFWPDVAHAMFVGLHGDGNLVSDIEFDNIDVLNLDEDDPEYQGAMAISAGDSNTVRNVAFRNIRVDHIEEGKLINVRVVYNSKYSFSPGQAVAGVTFQNIAYTGKGWVGKSVLGGYDKDRRVSDVVLDNVRVGGIRLSGPKDSELDIGPFVDAVTFR
jgi:polygalacturonase